MNFNIPDWFYLSEENVIKASTAAGSFDPGKALESKSAWVSTVGQSRGRQKKKILLADWTLEQDDNIDNRTQTMRFIKQLLEENFEIYCVKDGAVVKMNSICSGDFFHITPHHKKDLFEMMNEQGVSADDVVVLDFKTRLDLSKENPSLGLIPNSFGNDIACNPHLIGNFAMNSRHSLESVISSLDNEDMIFIDRNRDLSKLRTLSQNARNKINRIFIYDNEFSAIDCQDEMQTLLPNLMEINADSAKNKIKPSKGNKKDLSIKYHSCTSGNGVKTITDVSENTDITVESFDIKSIEDKDVHSLVLSQQEQADDLASFFKKNENCSHLSISNISKINCKGIEFLDNLVDLSVDCFSINQESLGYLLKKAPNLKKIVLQNMNGFSIEEKDALKGVECIELNNCKRVCLQDVLDAAPNLKSLKIMSGDVDVDIESGMYDSIEEIDITDYGMGRANWSEKSLSNLLKSCKNLKSLSLCGHSIDKATDLPKNSMNALHEIKIDFWGLSKVGRAEFLVNLLEAAPNVNKVSFWNLSTKSILPILKVKLNSLKEIMVVGPSLPENFVEALSKVAPNLSGTHMENPLYTKEDDSDYDYDDSPSSSNSNGMRKRRNVESDVTGIRSSGAQGKNFQKTLDTDTENNDSTFEVDCSEIIPLTVPKIKWNHAREEVYSIKYDGCEIEKKNISKRSFSEEQVDIEFCKNASELIPNKKIIERNNDSKDIYKAVGKVSLKAGKRQRLTSLFPVPLSELLQLKIFSPRYNSKELDIEVESCKQDGFYYITSIKDCDVDVMQVFGVSNKKENPCSNEKVLNLIKHCRSFDDGTNEYSALDIEEDAKAKDKLSAMYVQKKGACRHRAGVFLYQIEQMKKFNNLDKNVLARGVGGVCHAWVEVSLDNGRTWNNYDLGGHAAEIKVKNSQEVKSFAEEIAIEKEVKVNAEKNGMEETKLDAETISIKESPEALFVKSIIPDLTAKKAEVKYDSVNDFLNALQENSKQKEKKRILIKLKNKDMLNKLRNAVVWSLHKKNNSVFALDRYAQFMSSKPTVELTDLEHSEWDVKPAPSGPLFNFLNDNEKNKTLCVDWSALTASEMVRVNGLIDDHDRQVDGQKIADDTAIIGFITPPQGPDAADFMADSSFTSRQDIQMNFSFSEKALDQYINTLTSSSHESHETQVIDLYESPNWQNILLGPCLVKGQTKHWEKGPLVRALEKGVNIEIKNAPLNDIGFQRFIQDLEVTGVLNCYGQTIAAKNKALKITTSRGIDWALSATAINHVSFGGSQQLKDAYPINSSTLERCFTTEYVDGKVLYSTPGWIAQAASTKEKSIDLFVTDHLNEQQWAYLLDHANAQGVKLNLCLAPHVLLPQALSKELKLNQEDEEIKVQAESVESVKQDLLNKDSKAFLVSTNDVDCLSQLLTATTFKDALVVDASEFGDEDFLYGHDFELKKENNKDVFSFSEKVSQVWKTLQEKDSVVILRGKFSQSLIDHLSSLMIGKGLWSHNQWNDYKGRLILIAEGNRPEFDFIDKRCQVDVTPQVKKDALLSQENLDDGKLLKLFSDFNNETLFNQPYKTIRQAVRFAKAYKEKTGNVLSMADALSGQYKVAPFVESKPLNLTQEACSEFELARKGAVDFMLSWSPYVLLESTAGMGKSSFIEGYAKANGKSLFRKNQMEAWAQNDDKNTTKILFIDEANLEPTDWTQFAGLFDTPQTIFINGTQYPLTDKHKVVFAGNPVSYGAGRQEQRLFQEHPAVLSFPPMSAAYIHHKILVPILRTSCNENEVEVASEIIFSKCAEIYGKDFLNPEISNVTARDLQFMALDYCSGKITLGDKKGMHPTLERRIKVLSHKGLETNYVSTPSRKKAEDNFKTLFNVREFRLLWNEKAQKENQAVDNAVLYGGKSALLLDGPPGVGKSEFVKHFFAQYDFTNRISQPNAEETNNDYYFISASQSIDVKLALIDRAFHRGLPVYLEEINSSPLLEGYLNAYLMGTDINGKRPEKPGFVLVGSYNAASLRGRTQISPAIKSRSLRSHLDEYPKEELITILETKTLGQVVPKEYLEALVDRFLQQQAEAKKNSSLTMPTFRDLMRWFTELSARITQEQDDILYNTELEIKYRAENVEIEKQQPLIFSDFNAEFERKRRVENIEIDKQKQKQRPLVFSDKLSFEKNRLVAPKTGNPHKEMTPGYALSQSNDVKQSNIVPFRPKPQKQKAKSTQKDKASALNK